MKPTSDSPRNADETWQKACEIVGAWKTEHHSQVYPDCGDPVAAMKMLEWAQARYHVHIELWRVSTFPRCQIAFRAFDKLVGEFSFSLEWPEALASAVVATQEQAR